MTYSTTRKLMSAMDNLTTYSEANALEYASELPNYKLIDRNNNMIDKAKQTIWDIANEQGCH